MIIHDMSLQIFHFESAASKRTYLFVCKKIKTVTLFLSQQEKMLTVDCY